MDDIPKIRHPHRSNRSNGSNGSKNQLQPSYIVDKTATNSNTDAKSNGFTKFLRKVFSKSNDDMLHTTPNYYPSESHHSSHTDSSTHCHSSHDCSFHHS